jgi:hypothetical protein
MKNGAVAFIDALGFKGKWSRMCADQLLKRMEKLAEVAHKGTPDWTCDPKWFDPTGQYSPNLRVVVVSDTFAFFSWPKDDCEENHASVASSLARVVLGISGVLSNAVASSNLEERLCFRGAVATGEFEVKESEFGSFWLGPAVDEAAALEREADGAFVWLTKNALDVLPHLATQAAAWELLVKSAS